MKWVFATIAVPVVILFLSVSVVTSSFGISGLYRFLRLELANLVLVTETAQYLSPIQNILYSSKYLNNLVDNSGKPLYTANEISHLIDVKVRFDIFRTISLFFTVFLLIFLVYLFKSKKNREMLHVLQSGSKLTMILLAISFIFVIFFWNDFFILFHEILFPHGNWSFPIESSLIQLFPERFWFGFGASILCSALILSLTVYLFSKVCYNSNSFEQ